MPAAIKIFPEQLSAQLQSLTTDMQKQHAVTSEPDCEESLGEMILVFPVVLSTCGVQNMGNYHAAAWRGREKIECTFWSMEELGEPHCCAAHQTFRVLCVLVSGDGDGGSKHLSFCK